MAVGGNRFLTEKKRKKLSTKKRRVETGWRMTWWPAHLVLWRELCCVAMRHVNEKSHDEAAHGEVAFSCACIPQRAGG